LAFSNKIRTFVSRKKEKRKQWKRERILRSSLKKFEDKKPLDVLEHKQRRVMPKAPTN